MTHDQIMSSIRGGSSPNDDRPAPVVTTPVVPMDFGDDNNYTPTSAELDEAMKDMAAIGMPDMRRDQSAVDYSSLGNLDDRDARTAQALASPSLDMVQMARGTGGLGSVPDELSFQTPFNNTPSIPSGASIPDELSFQTPFNNTPSFPDELVTTPFNNANVTPTYLPDELITEPFNSANVTPVSLPDELTGVPFNNLGLGDPNATSGGQTGTGTGSGGDDEDDEGLTFLQRLARDFKAIPGNIAYDMKMLGYAGFFGSYENRLKRMMDNGVPRDIAKAWLDKSEETAKKMAGNYPSTTEDGTVGGVGVVDPCPEDMRLDPVAGICVPIEEGEGEDEGPSLSLNRTRDDEFNELDDIMKKIVKPIGESDDVRTMQAGGSVGLNRVADNFLAAMGG